MAYLKTSPIPFGWYYTAAFALLLPYSIAHYLTSDLAHKLTMGFSNVPGAKESWVITGKRCNSLGFIMPTGKTVVMGWGAITHGNTLKISVGADRAAVQDTEWLIRQFEKNLDSFLKNTKWR